ncbi:bleomycin resistance protein [Deinococcus puniceus]|uniref:Bleomycin resistance protein n=1 Tax=Deinococcus puniceus TaxID=1182568 RepID=A0A172T9K4_9DEIO|nr:VOC family protein [Deinococcus puniceus]ANE43699.1 glyoxalase [Deinococcus puniceus]
MTSQTIVPELYVSDLTRSLAFYTYVIGFGVRYTRPVERFVYLELGGAELMLEQPTLPERTFLAGELVFPYGRGINLSVPVPDVDAVYGRVKQANASILLPIEERWYRQDGQEAGNRQFVVADPDGYLLRIVQSLGQRPIFASG